MFLLAHLFDYATLPWFLAANRTALAVRAPTQASLWRVARVGQLLIIVLGAWATGDALWLFVPAAYKFALLIQAWFVPLLFALAWSESRATRGRMGAALTVLGMAIPLFN